MSKKSKVIQNAKTEQLKEQMKSFLKIVNPKPYSDEEVEQIKQEKMKARYLKNDD